MRTRQIAAAAAFAVGGAAIAALGMGGTAVARGYITGDDIENGTITGRDIRDHSIGERELSDSAQEWIWSHGGGSGGGNDGGSDRDGGGGRDGRNVNARWGLIDRNVIGAGYAALRTGPYESAFGNNLRPPSGRGSLHIQTSSGADQVDFGNEVDFVGKKVSTLTQLALDIYTTGENQAVANGGVNNLPGFKIEIDPDGPTGPLTYTTMVFLPTGAATQAEKFTHFTANDGTWFFTGSTTLGPGAVCNQTHLCTFAQAKAAVPNGTIYTIGVGKGRDHAFVGAVDDVQINDTVYDFEPTGVYARRVH